MKNSIERPDRTFDKFNRFLWNNRLLIIFFVSFVLRLIFFGELVAEVGIERLDKLSPDVKNYFNSARLIAEHWEFKDNTVKTFGPGFPVALVVLGAPFKLNPVVLTLLNILIGAMGSVLLMHFAFMLTEKKSIAILAGFQNAASLIAITLACTLLSETIYVTITLFGLILLLKGIKTEKLIYYAWSALLLSAALLIRSVGQFMWLIVLLIAACYFWQSMKSNYKKFLRLMIGPAIIVLTMIITVLLWTNHNERVFKFGDLTLSAPFGLSKLVRHANAEIEGISYEESNEHFVSNLEAHPTFKQDGYARALSVYSKQAFFALLAKHPFQTCWIMAKNAWYNMTIDWGGKYLLATGNDPWKTKVAAIIGNENSVLRYRVIFLIILGALCLLLEKRFRILVILSSITIYFGLLSTFTLNEGSRIFYPGQIGWAILMAYGLIFLFWSVVKFYRILQNRVKTLRTAKD